MQECENENESLYQRLLRTHPLCSRYKRQKTASIQNIVVKSQRPAAVTVTSTIHRKAINRTAVTKTATKACTANASSKNCIATKGVANGSISISIDDDDDDDDITLDGLDDPNVPSQWKPINSNEEKEKQQHEFLWKIGDTVELRSNTKGSIYSDFGLIIGTNDDGTYNMQNILTGGWKKFVPQKNIYGTYDDLISNSNSTSNSNSNSSDAGNDSEDSDQNESEEEEDCEDDYDGGEESQVSSEECVLI